MIIDKIEFCSLYTGLNEKFKKAFAFLQAGDFRADGERHEIDGADVYYIVQEYEARPMEKTALEAHRVYADIQYIYSGREKIGYAPLKGLEETVPYNPEKDIAKYAGESDFTELKAGMFAVYFPHEAHRPCLAVKEGEKVTKILVKIKC